MGVPTVELIVFLLMIAAALELLARRIGVPRPILLVIAGTVLALLPALPPVQVDPDVIFFVFLPPLLFWAALNTSYREFHRYRRDILLLAVGLVVATAAVVAAVARTVLPTLSWPAAFALGAAVGPTDAVAATAVMRRFGVPRALVSILEGESLVNDATSLVIFTMALAANETGRFSLGPALLRFVWTAGGGIAFGVAAGWCIARLRRWLEQAHDRTSVVQSSVSLLSPYVAFVPASTLQVSGVLAVVSVGLYLGRGAPRFVSAPARLQAMDMWQVLDFLLEGLLFILVGLGLRFALGARSENTTLQLAVAAALVSATVIVLRLVWIFPSAYLPRYLLRHVLGRREPYPPLRNVLFVGWAGLRGAVSLVLALSIPFTSPDGTPFPGRNLVIFLTFTVILVTLVGQGLTLAPAIRWLGLEPDRSVTDEESAARLQTARAGLARLERIISGELGRAADTSGTASGDSSLRMSDPDVRQVAEELRELYSHRAHRYAADARHAPGTEPDGVAVADDPEADLREADVDARRASAYQRLRLAMIGAERHELIRLRDDGRISDGVLHRIEHDLDLEELLLTTHGIP